MEESPFEKFHLEGAFVSSRRQLAGERTTKTGPQKPLQDFLHPLRMAGQQGEGVPQASGVWPVLRSHGIQVGGKQWQLLLERVLLWRNGAYCGYENQPRELY